MFWRTHKGVQLRFVSVCVSLSISRVFYFFFKLWAVVLILLLSSSIIYFFFFLLWVNAFIALCWTLLFFIHFVCPINLNTDLLASLGCILTWSSLVSDLVLHLLYAHEPAPVHPAFLAASSSVSRCLVATLSFYTDWALPCCCSHCPS